MKKQKSVPFMKVAILMIFGIALVQLCEAQDSAYKYPKPCMWSPNDNQLLKNFRVRKWPLINTSTGIEQQDSFFLGNFLGMIHYFGKRWSNDFQFLHVYIAQYSDEGDTSVPDGYGNMMTLIFAPAKNGSAGKSTDLGTYFVIPPDQTFDEKNPDTITPGVKQKWVRNYVNN